MLEIQQFVLLIGDNNGHTVLVLPYPPPIGA